MERRDVHEANARSNYQGETAVSKRLTARGKVDLEIVTTFKIRERARRDYTRCGLMGY